MKLATPILALVVTLSMAFVAEAQTKPGSGGLLPPPPSVPVWIPGSFSLTVKSFTGPVIQGGVPRFTICATDNTYHLLEIRASASGSFLPYVDSASAPLMIDLMQKFNATTGIRRSQLSLSLSNLAKYSVNSTVVHYAKVDSEVKVTSTLPGSSGGTLSDRVEGDMNEFVIYGKARASIPYRFQLAYGFVKTLLRDGMTNEFGYFLGEDFVTPNMTMRQKVSSPKFAELTKKTFLDTNLLVDIADTLSTPDNRVTVVTEASR